MTQPYSAILACAASWTRTRAGTGTGTVVLAIALAVAAAAGGCREGEQAAPASRTNTEQPPAAAGAEQPKATGAAAPLAGSSGAVGSDGKERPVDQVTGLVMAPGYEVVIATCTACHSAKLVVQNRGTRSDWEEMLRWMQAKHNLWQMTPEVRDTILEYLATNYGVDDAQRSMRRKPLASYLLPPLPGEPASPPEAAP